MTSHTTHAGACSVQINAGATVPAKCQRKAQASHHAVGTQMQPLFVTVDSGKHNALGPQGGRLTSLSPSSTSVFSWDPWDQQDRPLPGRPESGFSEV